jgi:hypothetical protein
MLDKNGIAKRIAKEIKDGYYVNLGIGIPTLVANYIPEGINVVCRSDQFRKTNDYHLTWFICLRFGLEFWNDQEPED